MKKILMEVLYREMKWVNTSMKRVRKTRRKRIWDLAKQQKVHKGDSTIGHKVCKLP